MKNQSLLSLQFKFATDLVAKCYFKTRLMTNAIIRHQLGDLFMAHSNSMIYV